MQCYAHVPADLHKRHLYVEGSKIGLVPREIQDRFELSFDHPQAEQQRYIAIIIHHRSTKQGTCFATAIKTYREICVQLAGLDGAGAEFEPFLLGLCFGIQLVLLQLLAMLIQSLAAAKTALTPCVEDGIPCKIPRLAKENFTERPGMRSHVMKVVKYEPNSWVSSGLGSWRLV